MACLSNCASIDKDLLGRTKGKMDALFGALKGSDETGVQIPRTEDSHFPQ